MQKPTFNSPQEEAIWEHGRNYERERAINAINLVVIDPDNDGDERHGFRIGLRWAIAVIMRLSYTEGN